MFRMTSLNTWSNRNSSDNNSSSSNSHRTKSEPLTPDIAKIIIYILVADTLLLLLPSRNLQKEISKPLVTSSQQLYFVLYLYYNMAFLLLNLSDLEYSFSFRFFGFLRLIFLKLGRLHVFIHLENTHFRLLMSICWR